MAPLTFAVILKVPASGVVAFQAYEARVLPLLAEFDGVLQRRLRNGDGTVECHIVRFPSRIAFEAFRTDPRRAEAAPLLTATGATVESFEVTDVEVER